MSELDVECRHDAAYVLGALNPTERAAYERHLAGCATCQTSMRELAGMPGLLALAGEGALAVADDTGPNSGPSDLMLPRLLHQVHRRRRRRLISVIAAVGVAAAAVVAAVVLAVRPAAAPVAISTPPSAVVSLSPTSGDPMAATIDLFDKQWGTSITVHCKEDGPHEGGVPYQLFVVDEKQQRTPVGSWTSIPGGASTVTAATALHRSQIAALQIQDADGEVVLSAPLR